MTEMTRSSCWHGGWHEVRWFALTLVSLVFFTGIGSWLIASPQLRSGDSKPVIIGVTDESSPDTKLMSSDPSENQPSSPVRQVSTGAGLVLDKAWVLENAGGSQGGPNSVGRGQAAGLSHQLPTAHSFRPAGTPGDERWSGLFSGPPGLSAEVYALAVFGSNLYVGGAFHKSYDHATLNHIAKWDGTTWSPLGSGVDGDVTALTVDGNGNLYAGGTYWQSGGVDTRFVAKWDGTTWSPLGSGIVGPGGGVVSALVTDAGGNLYVGGFFYQAGGVNALNIAKWDGIAWSHLGAGLNGDVTALAVDAAGNLYAGGDFFQAGGIDASHVAKWNGSAWSALGTGINDTISTIIYSLAADAGGNVYVGGYFDQAGHVSVANIAKWNGTAWSALGAGLSGEPEALTVDGNGDLYAAGSFLSAGNVSANHVAKWDGTAWSALGAGLSGMSGGIFSLHAVAAGHNNDVYVGGWFDRAGDGDAGCIARWNGTTWSSLQSGSYLGMNWLVTALTMDGGGNLFAGGWFMRAGGVETTYIAKFDGSGWSALGTGLDYGQIFALAADQNNHLYVGGNFTQAGGVSTPYLARWDGTAWSSLGAALNGVVRSLAVDGNSKLYVGGNFTQAGGVSAAYIAQWDGVAWKPLGSGMNQGYVEALVIDGGGMLYAGGYFTQAGGITANHIASWNGNSWAALGTGTNDTIHALAVDANGTLYAGGTFTQAGGIDANHVAKWDGTTWLPLGSGIDNYVFNLVLDGRGSLYAAGSFSQAGGVRANCIAMWDGTTWSALGSGISRFYNIGYSSGVDALTVDANGNVFVGGGFTEAGDKDSFFIAEWMAPQPVPAISWPIQLLIVSLLSLLFPLRVKDRRWTNEPAKE